MAVPFSVAESNRMREKTKAIIAVLFANFFFGTCIIAVKKIAPSLMSPLALTTIRVTVTTLLFWLMFAVRPVKTGISGRDYRLLFVCAVAGITLNQTFSIRGMSLTTPIHASLLVLTTPITITLLAAWLLRETLTAGKIAGLFLGIAGGVLLVLSRDLSGNAGPQQATGDLFCMLGAISYAVYVVLIRPLMHKYRALHILQWVFLFGCVVNVPLGWSSLPDIRWSRFETVHWLALIYVVAGATFIAYQLMNYSISKLGAGVTASFIYTQPFFATLASMILLNETLSLPKIIAGLLIMTGVYLASGRKLFARKRNAREAV